MTSSYCDIYAECILPYDTLTIRVLDLLPGGESDHLRGSLRLLQVDADPRPHYECVSYVWGNPKYTRSAVINDLPVVITQNLYDSLRQLRSKTETTALWADALCINQADFAEKSRQVGMMAEIYSSCSKVHVWLGKPEPGSLTGNPFRFLEHWVSGKHYSDLPGIYFDSATNRWCWQRNEECDNMLDDFLQIARSEWWTRAWTVQEVLLPKDSSIMFGGWKVTWDFMLKAEGMKNSHGERLPSCCKHIVAVFKPPQLPLIDVWMWHPSRGRRWMDAFRGQNWQPKFYEAIHAFASRECSDPRDKIYSMLALATHPVYQDFRPDYQEDCATVYTEVFKRMLSEAGNDFRCFMGGGFGSTMPGLPSWVRDFSYPRASGVTPIEERRMWYDGLYQASLAKRGQLHISDDRELRYHGTYVDTVKGVGPHVGNVEADVVRYARSKAFPKWLELCEAAMGRCDRTVLRSAFFRVICADVCKQVSEAPAHATITTQYGQFRRAKDLDFPRDEETWNRLLDGDLHALGMDGLGWGVAFGTWGRSFFTTVSNRMGLCHANTLPGDEVWLLSGARVPFTVRPRESAQPGCALTHTFLGDCFLHGIMDGEFHEMEQSSERTIVMI